MLNNNTMQYKSFNQALLLHLGMYHVDVCGEKLARRLDKSLRQEKHLNFKRLFLINIICGFGKN